MFLHLCVSSLGTHNFCDARLGNSASRLETLKVMLPDQDYKQDLGCILTSNVYKPLIVHFLRSFKTIDWGLKAISVIPETGAKYVVNRLLDN